MKYVTGITSLCQRKTIETRNYEYINLAPDNMGAVYSTYDNKEFTNVNEDGAPEVIIAHATTTKAHDPLIPPKGDIMNRNMSWKKNKFLNRASFDDIRIPFKLMCDITTQTEQQKPAFLCDSAIQTELETQESLINFTNVYLTESNRTTPVMCYGESSVQTDYIEPCFITYSYSSGISDSCAETNNIVEYSDAVNCFVHTNSSTSEEFHEYYDIGEEIMRRTGYSRNGQHYMVRLYGIQR